MPAIARARPIAIDGRAAARPELGGVERWARELAVRLPALRPGAYVVLRPPPALAHRAGHAWEQVVLPARVARLRARALLCPANLAPLAYSRSAVVIHDAAALRHPGWYSGAYARWQRLVLPAIARRAWRVITVSEFSRARAARSCWASTRRWFPAASTSASRPPPTRRRRAARSVSSARTCCASRRTPRARTSRRWCPRPARWPPTGSRWRSRAATGRSSPREPGLDGLRLLGHVDDALLPGLYAGAEAFALPSRYEGFGLPVLEAMACGTPVVAAAAGALPDTCGGAAVLAEPDGEAFAAALAALLRDAAERERLRAAGLARAAAFSWDATARAVDALLSDAGSFAVCRNAVSDGALTTCPRAHAAQAGPAERARSLLGRQPRVPVDALDPQLAACRGRAARGPCAAAAPGPCRRSRTRRRRWSCRSRRATTARSPTPACGASP